MVLEILQYSQEKNLARVSYLVKLQVWACNFIKKETLTQMFSCEFCGISKNTFFYRAPPRDCLYRFSNRYIYQQSFTSGYLFLFFFRNSLEPSFWLLFLFFFFFLYTSKFQLGRNCCFENFSHYFILKESAVHLFIGMFWKKTFSPKF